MSVIKNDVGRPSNKTIKIRRILKGIAIVPVVALLFFAYYKVNDKKTTNTVIEPSKKLSKYRMENNSLSDFDLFFLKAENNDKNSVYSPLSIKQSLALIKEGANGQTKTQINDVIGDYKFTKYENSKNISLKNVMFVKNSYKNNINQDYASLVKDKYNSDVIYDEFASASNINSWVSDNTLNLINNLFKDSDLNGKDFVIANALAIDMDWVNKIQKEKEQYYVKYNHEKFDDYIPPLSGSGFSKLKFNNSSKNYNSVQLAAAINRYDIVKELGEDNIRKTVGDKYEEWLNSEDSKDCIQYQKDDYPSDVNKYLDKYIKDLNSNYEKLDNSTDFLMYDDSNVKAFAKDLKEYNGVTLQYIGIMPKQEALNNYIKELNSKKLNDVISSLKEIKLDNFESGKITKINANIPLFDFDYELDLKNDLNKIGITNIFDSNKSDLSKFTKAKGAYIDSVTHKANISFSNDGIKASAITAYGGLGDAWDCFDYLYDVPVNEIDLTFDKPYIFIIRNKNSGEVWFVGSVYEPSLYTESFGY